MEGSTYAVPIIPTYVIIPTRDRPQIALDCIESICHQATTIVILNNGYLPGRISFQENRPNVFWTDLPQTDSPNIQALWNVGIKFAELATRDIVDEWNVLILNDDVICPSNLVEQLNNRMRATSAVLAYPDQFGGTEEILHKEAAPVDLKTRITGYAYMLRGESRIRLDEGFGWWYGDDDLDWRCREAGGSLLVPGCAVEHRYPNAMTNANPALVAQTAIDRQTFINKWGRAPH